MEHARSLGYEFVDADCTLACQEPKITPHRDAMRENVARAIGCPVENVGVKATTTERLGWEGEGGGHRRLGRLPSRAMYRSSRRGGAPSFPFSFLSGFPCPTRRKSTFCKVPRSYRLFKNDNDVGEAVCLVQCEFRTSRSAQ